LSLIVVTIFLTAAHAQQAGRTAGKRLAKESGQKPAAKPDPVFNDLSRRAAEAMVAEKLDEALPLYQQALRRRPDWAEGWWMAGTILYERDIYAEARDALRALVSLDPKNGPGWGMLGLCEFQTREYERAIVSLLRGRLLGLGANDQLISVVRYHTAITYTRLEQYEAAFDVLREFIREQKESPKIIEAFGLTLLRMPFLPTETPPDKRELVLLAGQAAYQMAARRGEVAEKIFKELLARYSSAPNVHYGYGVFLLTRDADAALGEFRHELEISPEHVPAMLQIAFEYLKRDEHEAALSWAEKSVQLAPKLFPARNALGRILLELGQVDRAIKELEEGVKLAPDSPEMRFALARAYARAGRQQDAAREREAFTRLDKLYRAQREGPQSGEEAKASPDEKPPRPKP
jgi:predicted Zn-dependent protease